MDSVIVSLGKKKLILDELAPFMIKDMDASATLKVMMFSKGDTLSFAHSDVSEMSLNISKKDRPLVVNDKVVFGLLAIVLALIFYTSHKQTKFWKTFYMIVPALLLCYLIPAILDFFGLISKEYSNLYPMARDYLLPAALILMTLGIDFKAILNLGPKAIIMFLTATVGIIIGGPIAIIVYSWIDPTIVQTFSPQFEWGWS